MLPLLRIAGDGKEHSLAEARGLLAAEFHLSEAELDEPLPSGRQSGFANRVAWAKVYLEQGGLLVSPRRGHFAISDRGREVLKAPPGRIDIKFLEQYPEFIEFRRPKAAGEEPTEVWINPPNTVVRAEASSSARAARLPTGPSSASLSSIVARS